MTNASPNNPCWIEDQSVYRIILHDYYFPENGADYGVRICYFVAENLAQAVSLADEYHNTDRQKDNQPLALIMSAKMVADVIIAGPL